MPCCNFILFCFCTQFARASLHSKHWGKSSSHKAGSKVLLHARSLIRKEPRHLSWHLNHQTSALPSLSNQGFLPFFKLCLTFSSLWPASCGISLSGETTSQPSQPPLSDLSACDSQTTRGFCKGRLQSHCGNKREMTCMWDPFAYLVFTVMWIVTTYFHPKSQNLSWCPLFSDRSLRCFLDQIWWA